MGFVVVSFAGDALKLMWEVKSQRGDGVSCSGYSDKAQRTGNHAYLEPNSSSMQKPVEGLSEKIEDRSRIGCRVNQKQCRRLIKREAVSTTEHNSTPKTTPTTPRHPTA